MGSQSAVDVTDLLHEWRKGDASAPDRLIPLVYAELRKLAHRCLQGERAGDALQTTELINEAYLKLVNCSRVKWNDRTHFFRMAAKLMRRVLVEEARERLARKKGGQFTRVSFDEAMTVSPDFDVELVIAIHEALERLAEYDPRKAQIVELRYFGGLSIEETAAAMGVSIDIVKRDWRTARLWLMKELTKREVDSNGSSAVGED